MYDRSDAHVRVACLWPRMTKGCSPWRWRSRGAPEGYTNPERRVGRAKPTLSLAMNSFCFSRSVRSYLSQACVSGTIPIHVSNHNPPSPARTSGWRQLSRSGRSLGYPREQSRDLGRTVLIRSPGPEDPLLTVAFNGPNVCRVRPKIHFLASCASRGAFVHPSHFRLPHLRSAESSDCRVGSAGRPAIRPLRRRERISMDEGDGSNPALRPRLQRYFAARSTRRPW